MRAQLEATVRDLRTVISSALGDFASTPSGLIPRLAGLRIVPVLSSETTSKELEHLCMEKGIHCNVRDATGFKCRLAMPPLSSAD